jgi:cystathionine gamma-synthase
MEYFCHIPCGRSMPLNNPHAVSVSLPSIADVIGYEENDPKVKDKIESAYPRFITNRFVAKAAIHIAKQQGIDSNRELIPVSSEGVFDLIEQYIGKGFDKITSSGFPLISIKKDSPLLLGIKYLIQHAGLIPSSRQAEDYLLKNKLIDHEFEEELAPAKQAVASTKQILSKAYGYSTPDDVILCSAGMNAIFSVFQALKKTQAVKGRNKFIQIGWLYSDSMSIIKKYSKDSFQYLTIPDMDEFEKYVHEHNSEITSVFLEVPNNPVVRCADLPRIAEITKKYNIILAVDSTIGTPYNIEVLKYADIAVESLTKFACGNGDILMGAVILNKNSEKAQSIKNEIKNIAQTPYIKDVRRLAFEIESYEERVKKVSKNTFALVDYLKSSNKVKSINWVLDDFSRDNYLKICKNNKSVPGIISLVFDKKLHNYYDNIKLSKGPSLGTSFTLAMPYIYLAHYDLLKSANGKSLLDECGIDSELLRVSIGLEPAKNLINVFKEVLE